jgi:hypothetical protein
MRQLAGVFGVRDELLVGLVALLPTLVAFLSYGALETPDSGGYIYYAEQLRAGTLPTGTALLMEAPSPISLFRTAGSPALIAVTQSLFGTVGSASDYRECGPGSDSLQVGGSAEAIPIPCHRCFAVAFDRLGIGDADLRAD